THSFRCGLISFALRAISSELDSQTREVHTHSILTIVRPTGFSSHAFPDKKPLTTALASRDGRDHVEVEVLLAFFGGQVAGDAAAVQRHQQVNVHGIDLNDSVGSGGKKAFACEGGAG